MSDRLHPLRWYDAITINIYYTGLTALSQTMTPLVIPLLVQQFVGETRQGSAFGTIRLWSLMAALLVQSFMGMISDHSTLRLGRRRPFILVGTLGDIIVIGAIGFSASLAGEAGFWMLFSLVILLMISSNTAHGAVQGLIPDIVPEDKRGIYSGVKALFEVPLPLILIPFTIGNLISTGNLWGGLLVTMIVLAITMSVTLFAPEKRFQTTPYKLDLEPIIRLVLMTTVFTLFILCLGFIIRQISNRIVSISNVEALISMGLVTLLAILLAIGLGVYVSVQISIGSEAQTNPSFTWWVINRLTFLVGATNIASFTVFFLQGRLGMVRETAVGPATRLVMVVGLFILLVSLPAGWLADRFGHKNLVGVSGISAFVGTIVIISAPSLAVIYLGGIILGVAIGLFYTSNWALGTEIVSKNEAGRYLGISNLAGAGAGAIGAYIGGPTADFFTIHTPQIPGLGYVLLFIIYGILFLFSIFALKKVNPIPAFPI